MEPGLYAYFVDADAHDPDTVRNCIGKLQLDNVWLHNLELEPPGARRLRMVELVDLESGAPLDVTELGLTLSEEGGRCFFAAVDPSGEGAAFEVFADGAQRFAWSGRWGDFQHADHGVGREGFATAVRELVGLDWDVLVEAAGKVPRILTRADDHTELLLRGRALGMPDGMSRTPELFFPHYGEEEEDEVEPPEESPEAGQLMLVMLDPALLRFLWQEAPAAQVAAFLQALEPMRAAVLGPLAHALPDVMSMVSLEPPERPLAESGLKELVAYEVLAMATAVAFSRGEPVSIYDELLLPLLALSEAPVVPAAVEASLEEIRELDVLRAMVEVMPYSAPEGELLECIGDDELQPLAGWASDGDVYEGSIFTLDTSRIARQVERFDRRKLERRMEEFRRVWADVLPPSNLWHAGQGELDQLVLEDLDALVEELRRLLALAQVNALQPAIFFYGD